MNRSSRKFLIVLIICLTLGVLAVTWSHGVAGNPSSFILTKDQPVDGFVVGYSSQNDTSPMLLEIPAKPVEQQKQDEAAPNLPLSIPSMKDADPAIQSSLGINAMPSPILNFDGIPFPGVNCNCAPPDPNGEVGATQYVQMVNEGIQVFNKTTGSSVLGPIGISTLWSGFGGLCETSGLGDPIVLYDQLANRWIISQFAGTSAATDECIAVSTTSDATGSYYRYDFVLGTNFYDYPKLAVWPDAYYMGENVFNAAGTAFLGPQPFAFNRAAMLVGAPAIFVTFGPLSPSLGMLIPADLDGSNLPPAGAPNPWMGAAGATWPLYRFHVDFAIPANSTFTLASSLIPAAYSDLCPSTRSCVPQLGSLDGLDGIGDRPMFRLAYRRFGDGHEALVGNRSVAAGGVSGIRWWEVNNATSGTPSFVQQSTYQPDTTWRWMGSIAMDIQGNIALGFSASSSTINPQIRYAGRLASDPLNTLAQGEATLFAGTGSQTGTSNRWGDYSDLTVDPVDDCTFWYTNEYYQTTGIFNWRTRIGSFKFPSCSATPNFSLTATPISQSICTPSDAVYTTTVSSLSGFTNPVTLSASSYPSGATSSFSVNPVTPSGSSNLTIGNTGAATAGSYNINIVGISASLVHTTTVALNLYTVVPGVPTLIAPANGASSIIVQPTFQWSPVSQAASYTLEIAKDAGFTNIVHTISGLIGTTYNGATLNTSTTYFWRVRTSNTCGTGTNSATFTFTTVAAPGDCAPGTTPNSLYSNDFESNTIGWAHSGTGDTWALSTTNPHSGLQSWHADDLSTVSDQRLVSPGVLLPAGQNPVTLKFWNWQHMETRTGGCYDGGILEVTTDGGSTWTQLTSPNLLTDPYDGPISASFSNPLANLNAWCGNNPQPYLNSIVDISSYAGQTVQFRFRLGSDNSVSRPGWNIDDVSVQSCVPNAAPGFVSVNVTPGSINENDGTTLTGLITDPDPTDTHNLQVNWGDGTVTQTLPILDVGVFSFSVTHQYLDDNPTGTTSDLNPIKIMLSDNFAHSVYTATQVTVNNVTPLVNVGPDLQSNLNVLVQFNGTFTDPGTQDTHNIVWDFSDGTIITGTLTPQHAFSSAGPHTVTLTVTDDDTGVGSDSLVVQVNPWLTYLPLIVKQPGGIAGVNNAINTSSVLQPEYANPAIGTKNILNILMGVLPIPLLFGTIIVRRKYSLDDKDA